MGFVDVLVQVLLGALVHALLHQLQLLRHGCFQLLQLDHGLFAVVAAHQDTLIVLQISGTALHPQRHALHLILGTLPAHGVVGVIQLHPETGVYQPLLELGSCFQNAGLMLGNGQDNHLDGGDLRGQNQAVVVAVGHDHRTDHPGRAAPGGLEGVLQLVVPTGEGDIIGAAELVAEIVGGGTLERLVILHHALHGIGGLCTGELLLLGLPTGHHGNCQHIFKEICIAVQLLLRLGLCLLGGFVDGVAFLPPELAGAQEGAGGLLPADDGAPLVIQHGQLAVGLQDVRPVVAEHRLGSGAEGQTLFQLFTAAHGDPSHFGGEAVDQLPFFFQQALWNQHGHCHILVAGLLKFAVHDVLDVLPNGIAIGAQDGKALDGGILHQLRLAAHVRIPLGKIHLHVGDLLNLFIFGHFLSSQYCKPASRVFLEIFNVLYHNCQELYSIFERNPAKNEREQQKFCGSPTGKTLTDFPLHCLALFPLS